LAAASSVWALVLSVYGLNNRHEGTSISVTDTQNTYTISATYPQNQTDNIKNYLMNSLKTNIHF
jgi:hypothetical protein